ncbi:hypothetical protein HMPREF2139_12355 [Prevotella denticola DNF00960]|nr:hypothetical protein HMPREF2139_12355 [Prevotella denticola DNF00960]
MGTYTDRIDRTAAIFGKGDKIIINDRLVTVASYDICFRIISGIMAHGTPSKYCMVFLHPFIKSSLHCDDTASL